MAAVLVYLGGALDHEVIPQQFPAMEGIEGPAKEYRDGKGRVLQDKRMPLIKEAETKTFEIKVYDLWGKKFPKNEPVTVTNAKLIAKAKALGCFEVREDVKAEAKVDGKKGDKKE
jgi:hypothetical protein